MAKKIIVLINTFQIPKANMRTAKLLYVFSPKLADFFTTKLFKNTSKTKHFGREFNMK